ncbi:MAG: phosphoribosylformylglycinamidine synthase [Eubacteriales bacterium]|nr:phosphoribosylformylglycinamidine synthase [Eubacteriales bacterium]
MIHRIYVEKKPGLQLEAAALLNDITGLLQIRSIPSVRVLNRYDVEGPDEALFARCRTAVFSEPQVDDVYDELPADGAAVTFAVEYLPGQFDQRADSAAQCVQILSQGERPLVRTARIYMLYGAPTPDEVAAVKHHVINPVECRETTLDPAETLQPTWTAPGDVETLIGFTAMDDTALNEFLESHGLAMDLDDLRLCREHFKTEGRDPTITELRVLDTYWSDHCRHTTFLTSIDSVCFGDPVLERTYESYLAARKSLGRTSPVCLMDIATMAARYLRANGTLSRLDESPEINACTVKVDVTVEGRREPWLLLFKNETHNHPTEIEPFGGAATCIGGAIRDPLSGRAYVYAAMRLTGAADPLAGVRDTLPGKLPQRKITSAAASGYSSYGNQIGLATGLVDEVYHPNYAAKRMEIGAVIGAVPEENVRREVPVDGDLVILLGGRTGRDGIGGATGSSKAHDLRSLDSCGAEVQKGNAPEERKLQRFFRRPECSRLIKRCNDFGAGGVAVAVGELADGLEISLDNVRRKYEGLDGTELAISESQERMAVVVAQEQAEHFLNMAAEENLEATVIARVTASPRLVMRWNNKRIVDLPRSFLASNGAEKHIDIELPAPETFTFDAPNDFSDGFRALCSDLSFCSRRGLAERFDSTIGAGTLLMPFGGKRQLTPIQAMAHRISDETRVTDTCSIMSWGFDPYLAEKSPYHAAHLAVVHSAAKLVAAGASLRDTYLSFQEFFGKPRRDPVRWGAPMAALLGAFRAQMELQLAAIGGKDSMSGTFEDLDVPPTLVSFAVTTEPAEHVLSPEFKAAGHAVTLLMPEYGADGLPLPASFLRNSERIYKWIRAGKVLSVWAPGRGGAAEAVFKMCLGNGLGFRFDAERTLDELFSPAFGAYVLEWAEAPEAGTPIGNVTAEETLCFGTETLSIAELFELYEGKLEPVFPCRTPSTGKETPVFTYHAEKRLAPSVLTARPRVLIPVFPGTNCEYDSARAFAAAGVEPECFIVRNLTAEDAVRSAEKFAARLREAQIIFLPGGFSSGDEPDGSGKFIAAFFRNPAVTEETMALLDRRGGLMAGICNGFQALVKLGLVPYGRILAPEEIVPTLTYNVIGRHQSRIVRVRTASDLSPWMARTKPGDIYALPISHGEGRFLAPEAFIQDLADKGQVATQYVDAAGQPTDNVLYNPNGSVFAVESISSPDGRVLGRMGHAERAGAGLCTNVPDLWDAGLFAAAADFFKK